MPPKKTIKPTPVTVAPLTVTEYAQKFTAAKTYAARAALHADVVSRENQLRGLFAQQRTIAPEVQDPNVLLLPVHDLPAPLRTVPKVFEEERAIPVVMPNADKLPEGRQVIADRTEFLLNWKLFTAGALDCIDWNNMFAAGGSIQACLTHLPPNTTYGERRDYFLEKHGSADVDLFVYGLSPAAAMEKMNKIYDQVMDAVPFDVVAVRTSHAVTIVSQYPYRHIQIVLRLYKSPAETLMGFDVDSCAVGYNGVSVLCTPRAHFALITQANTVDMTRRSPTYESRLAKYAQRGYEVRVPGLTRERIDPQIYERSFDKVRGLGRLLLFEALGDQENRMRFKEIQRERKGRPPHPHAGRYESRNHLRAGDLKAQEAFESSDYQSVFLPFGPAYNAARIVRVLNKKDRGMNNAWFMRKRGVKVHQHPCFFGFMSEVMEDACGACPRAKTQKDKDDLDGYVHGPLKFITDDPGRQSIGSFHPITDEEWSVDAYIDPKRSPLFAAVAHGTVEDMTSLLTKLGPDFDLESRDWTGRTLLQLATMCGRLDMVELLLKRGARVSAPLPDGRLPIHVAAEYGLVEIAKRLWAKQVANAEIEAAKPKADPAEAVDVDAMDVDDEEDKDDDEDEDDEDDDYGGSDEGDDDDDAMDEDQDDDDGQAKKTRAGKDKGKKKGGDDDGDEDDEELGPDVHSIDHRDWDFKMAPIHYAVMYGHIDLVRWLIEVGASPTREFTSKSGYQFSDTWHPLSLTLLTPDRTVGKAISELLLEHGATATQEILLACLQHGATEFLLHLLEVDPSASKPEVIQALFNASLCQDNADLVREFIKRGAVVHFTIEEIMRRDGTDRNSAENTLMYITQPITMVIPQYGNPKAEFAKILVEAGAATNFKYSRWSNDALIDVAHVQVQSALTQLKSMFAQANVAPKVLDKEAFSARIRAYADLESFDAFIEARAAPQPLKEADGPLAAKTSDKAKADAPLSPFEALKKAQPSFEAYHKALVDWTIVYDLLLNAGEKLNDVPETTGQHAFLEEARALNIPFALEVYDVLYARKLVDDEARTTDPAPTSVFAGIATMNIAAPDPTATLKFALLTQSRKPARTAISGDAQVHYHKFFDLVWEGNVAAAKAHVQKHRVLVTCRTMKGDTPLSIAALRKNAGMVRLLIQLAAAQFKYIDESGEGKKVKHVNNYDLDNGGVSDGGSDDGSSAEDNDDDNDPNEDENEGNDDSDPKDGDAVAAVLQTSLTDVKTFLQATYEVSLPTDPFITYTTVFHHMILIRWVDGIKAIVEEVRAAAKKFPTAVEYGWEVLKSSGIEWVDGDFIDDLVAGYFSGETGHEPTSASRFAISAQGHFVQALQLGAIDIVRYLVQETLGGYQLQLFHHLDGRLNDERKKQDFAAEYKGFKAAERFAGKAGGVGGRVRSGRKQTEFNPEICFWSFYAAKAGETKALEYLTSDEVREDVRAFIKKRAAAKDPRALELKDAPTLERFLDHALSMTDNSRGTNKATLLHAVMTASPTSKLLVALESFVGPLSYHLMLNQPDGKGYTPLFYAAIHAVPRRVLATLIRQGADPLVTEPKRGWTAFHMLVHNDASARKLLDTFLAVVPPATVMQLMSAKSNMYGHTPLMLATIEGNHAAVKTLLAFMKTHGKRTLGGAEALPFAADVAGMSPVHWAVAKNHTAILKLMHDALPAAPAWRAENADGTTPAARVLHSARMNIFYRTAKPKLVEAFADPFKEVEVRELDPVDLDDETIDETKETYTVTRATQYKDTTGSTYHLVKAAGLLDPTKLADRAIAQMSDVQAVVGMMGKVLRQGEIDYAADQELRNGYANVSF